MGAFEIRKNLYWIGALDKDLRVFDVVMRTEYGTTYNSYLLKTPNYKVLFETVKEKFFDVFMTNLKEVCDPSELDYIVINHTEPDHTGSLEKLLTYAPQAKVLASPIALSFLKEISNRDIPGKAVFDNQTVDLDGCKLRFLSVPFLHWPDSIYTYIEGMDTLVTCDSFGCHYADEKICNDLIKGDFKAAYKYYFDMIMGPFKPYVQYALGRIKDLKIDAICPGHGPVLRENLDYYIKLYDEWSKEPPREKRAKPQVTVALVSAYGYTETLAQEIINGVKDEIDADINVYDMVYADAGKVASEMATADGLLVGSPTINGDALPPVLDLIMNMNGVLHGGKVAGAFGSYGWSGEAADMLMDRLNVLRMDTVEPPLKINFKPAGPKLEAAKTYGRRFGRRLREKWESFTDKATGKTYWKCTVCGEIFEGALPPASCPVCGAGQEAFVEYVPEIINFRDDKEMKVVIVGSGAAAISTADALRKRNAKVSIDIYSKEEVLPYYRPVLTKAIAEKVHDTEFLIQPSHYYEENNINLHLGEEAESIGLQEKRLRLKSGESVSYDKLVLATGAHCFIPPIQGAHLQEVIALREQGDFDKLSDLIAEGKKRIVVIGGGLLGMETADSLSKLGHELVILEACPSVLPRQIDPDGAPVLEKVIAENSDITVQRDVFVVEICGHEKVIGVKTKRDKIIDCDIVIISAGIRSNVELAKNAGLKIDRAIAVDEKMRTSNPDIYAVGDCAVFKGRFDGIWETAIEQGKVAGADIAGDNVEYRPKVFGATLHAFGASLFSVGDIGAEKDATYERISSKDELARKYSKFYFKDGELVGGVLLGDVSKTNSLLSGVTRSVNLEEAKDSKLV